MPDRHLVCARRHAADLEATVGACDARRVIGHGDPASHPPVGIALHTHDPRTSQWALNTHARDRNRHVEHRPGAVVVGMGRMQRLVFARDRDLTSRLGDLDAWLEIAVFVVDHRRRGGGRPRHTRDDDHRIGNTAR